MSSATCWYYKYKEEGRCTRCGQKLPDEYYFINCEPCRAKHNPVVKAQSRERRRRNR